MAKLRDSKILKRLRNILEIGSGILLQTRSGGDRIFQLEIYNLDTTLNNLSFDFARIILGLTHENRKNSDRHCKNYHMTFLLQPCPPLLL